LTTTILLDPAVAIPSSSAVDLADFWTEFVEWQQDKRSRFGIHTYELFQEFCSTRLYADSSLVPAPLRASVHRSVAVLMGRAPVGEVWVDTGSTLSRVHRGEPQLTAALRRDLHASASTLGLVVGSRAHLWDGILDEVGCLPPPPAGVRVHLEPGLPTPAETAVKIKSFFDGVKLLIVGGQIEPRTRAALSQEFGIPESQIEWVPSEYNKKPNNLPAMVNGAAITGALVFCITGKVGHSTSGLIEKECSRRGVKYVPTESSASVRQALLEMFDRTN
jgi:hypothetical protein